MTDEADGTPPDLRFTKHAHRDVEVERDLSGQGHLARGDHTRMSRLNFSARGRPADPGERDPEFVKREAASRQPARAAEPASGPAPEITEKAPPGLLARLSRLFGQ